MEPQSQIPIIKPIQKVRGRKRTHSDGHVTYTKFEHHKSSSATNWGDGPNNILADALSYAEHAVELDEHIERCSTRDRTRRRAVNAYRQTIERLQMAIQYQEPKEQTLCTDQDEPLKIVHRLIEQYMTRMDQLKTEQGIPEEDEDDMDEDEDEDDDEEEDEDEDTDDGNETVTNSPPPQRTSMGRSIGAVNGCIPWGRVSVVSGNAQDVNDRC